MLLHEIHTLLERVYKALDQLRIFCDKALPGAEGGVRHIAGIYAKGSDDITGSFLLQGRRARLEFDSKIPLAAGKRRGSGAKINALVDVHIHSGIQVILF